VGGTQGGRLRITVQSEGDTDERLLPQRISFLPDDVVGTPAQPLLISIDEATAIGHVGRDTDTDAPLFNLQGLRLGAVPAGHGVYIQQGRKVLQ
ncbi:MAG: hypothetical protein KBS75_07480, partial [Bacteroidales bacterium]|nr:hypothetical protein [Candidatus Equimonas faecalis]MBQ0165023.1 hypothetical protein [Candidatus Equimonas faecalis]